MVLFNIPHKRVKEIFKDSKKLKRVRVSQHRTKIVGADEVKIQKTKQDLDTLILAGKQESKAKKELKRLGILHG